MDSTSGGIALDGSRSAPIYRVVIVRKDGSTLDAVDLASQALNVWERFFAVHQI
jgi:hypothetical protein